MNFFSVAAKYCNTHTRIAVIRSRHGPHKFLLHAVPLINDMAGRFVATRILYVGATMKHCFVFIKVTYLLCCITDKKENIVMYSSAETSGKEAGADVVETADGDREKRNDDGSADVDACYERL